MIVELLEQREGTVDCGAFAYDVHAYIPYYFQYLLRIYRMLGQNVDLDVRSQYQIRCVGHAGIHEY